MKARFPWLILLSVVVVIGAHHYAERVWATPASGFATTFLTPNTGVRYGEIDVFNQFIPTDLSGGQGQGNKGNVWLSWQKTKGESDLYMVRNNWKAIDAASGAVSSTGWHTHPGHSLIVVTAGTVTAYEGDDPACTPHIYTAGMGFVDPGHGHVHILRNETNAPAETIAVQLVPAGQARRTDVDAPGNCPF
jgi:quercetin dioxygenase-like cupin family protein